MVSLAEAIRGGLSLGNVPRYMLAQFFGAVAGVWIAHIMFGEPVIQFSQHVRSGSALLVSELVATFGLLLVIFGVARNRSEAVPYAVGAYITGAYWFTASTSFANPAVTLARTLTNTFSGIRPADAPGFIAFQIFGAAAAIGFFRWLSPALPKTNEPVCVNQRQARGAHVR